MNVWTGFGSSTDDVAGAGPAESLVQLADSMTRAGEGDIAEIGGNLAASGLDLLGAALDPVGTLATAGIGWLIEHVSFLREPLDWLAGSPDNIKKACQDWNGVALKLDEVGKQQDQALNAQVKSWEKVAADAFRASHGKLAGEIRSMGASATAVSAEIANFGTLVATVRGTVRDIISMFIFEVIRNAAIALAGSFATFGAAAAAFGAWAVGRGAMVLGKVTKLITKVLGVAGRVAGRLKGLFSKMGDMMKGLGRFGRGGRAADAPPAPTRSTSTPDTPGQPGLGQRMEDWGRTKADNAQLGDKAKQAGREAWDGYKNAGNTWNRSYQQKWDETPIGSRAQGGSAASDAYSPLKNERPDGTFRPHSLPSVRDGAFMTKFSGDLIREETKEDELRNEVPESTGQQKDAASERVERMREQDTQNRQGY